MVAEEVVHQRDRFAKIFEMVLRQKDLEKSLQLEEDLEVIYFEKAMEQWKK